MIHVTLQNGEAMLFDEHENVYLKNGSGVQCLTGAELLDDFPRFGKPRYVMQNRYEAGVDSPIQRVRQL